MNNAEYITTMFSFDLQRAASKGFDVVCDLIKIISGNTRYSGRFTSDLVKRHKLMETAIDEVNDFIMPSAGHRVKIVCSNGKVYENALIDHVCTESGNVRVCMQASAHICGPLVADTGLSLSVSGGYFKSAPWERFSTLDTVDSRYWFWGASACADGGIYISRPMKRWLIDDSTGELGYY